MFIRLLKVAFFVVAAASTSAYALSIAGWGFKVGSVVAKLDLRGVPNPTTKPTIAIVTATLDQIEYLCRNPNDYNVAPGSAGQLTVSGSNVVSPDEIVDKGKAYVEISFDIPAEFSCVNPNWTYIMDSAAAKLITARIAYHYCTGDAKTDPEPCYEGNELTIDPNRAAVVEGTCTLDPVLRNYDGTVVPGQGYICVQTSP